MATVLLVDGDIVAYQTACAVQRLIGNPSEDAFGFAWAFADCAAGRMMIDNMMARLKADLKADGALVALSGKANWRHQVMPGYKANRDDLQRPIILGLLKDHLRDDHDAQSVGDLEADDLIGIWATSKHWGSEDRRIIVTKDKDLQGIPGWHHTMGAPAGSVREISKWQATRFHLIQALAGDRVDGYGGCPGLGMDRAAKIIDSPVRLVPQEGVITAGKNKGQKTTRWMSEPTDDYWACIVSHYRKAGLQEADALQTARVAKILWADEYDMEKHQVTLWTPERLRA